MSVLRLVLGDQLSDDLSALKDMNPDVDTVLMAEVRDEATYVRHHKQKLALVFAAMRNHAERLKGRGVNVRYVRIDDADNSGSITGELARVLDDGAYETVVSGGWPSIWPPLRKGRGCRSRFARIAASSAATTVFAAGPRASRSCAWSSSIARCAVRRAY